MPPELTAIADQWARTAADPAFLNLNEKPLQGQFLADLTARLIAIGTAIDDRVYHLFNLTDADRLLLADHSRHAMIDYPYGAL